MNESRPVVFVTGGTGLLGNCIVRELLQRDFAVRSLCRSTADDRPFADLNVEQVRGDLSDPQRLQQQLEGCSAVVHCAAYIHVGRQNLDRSRAVNVEGTRHVAEACLQHGIRMIHVSTVDTLWTAPDAQHPVREDATTGLDNTSCSYVTSKSEAEQLVQRLHLEQGLDSLIVHPGFLLGPYDWKPSSGRMMLQVVKTPFLFAPPGGCSVCDPRDVAFAIVNSLQKGQAGRSYILAGENITYQQLWQRMLEVAGKPAKQVRALRPRIKLIGAWIDAVHRWLPIAEGDVNGASIAMGCLFHYYSSQRAQQELGYQPRSTEETLADAWSWLSDYHLK